VLSALFSLSLLTASLFATQAKPGSIEGHVFLPDGMPAAAARVALVPADTQGVPTMSNIATTDDSGGFNLGEIPPGQYYVVAGVAESLTYYPGVERSKAALVTVRAGAKTANVTFTLLQRISFKLTGRVVDYITGRGRPTVWLYDARFFPSDRPAIAVPDDQGVFDYSNVAPGSYFVGVNFPYRQGVAVRSVLLDGRDVTKLELRVLPQIEVSGRIVMRAAEPLPSRVYVQADPPSTFSGTDEERLADSFQRSLGIRTIAPEADGTFKLILTAGEHQVVVTRLSADYEVQSIRQGDQDLLHKTLKVGMTPVTDVEIVLVRRR
jgi:hypothetical protein